MEKFKKSFLINSLGLTETDAKLIMEAQRKFSSILLEDRDGFCVDARTLWKELGQPQGEFNKWIDRKLITKNYIENKDYFKIDNFVEVGKFQGDWWEP